MLYCSPEDSEMAFGRQRTDPTQHGLARMFKLNEQELTVHRYVM